MAGVVWIGGRACVDTALRSVQVEGSRCEVACVAGLEGWSGKQMQ